MSASDPDRGGAARGADPPEPPLDATRLRKLRDSGLILPLTGLALLMPPLAGIVAVEATVFGVPLVLAYVFAVWLGLILVAMRLARRLAALSPPPRQDHPVDRGRP